MEKLDKIFKEKAKQIALLKFENSDYKFNYDYTYVNYNCEVKTWQVEITKKAIHDYDDDHTVYYNISEEEILSDINKLELKFKEEYQQKILEREKLKKKEILEKEKQEFELYKKLKEKYKI